jgi:hypothetical protein
LVRSRWSGRALERTSSSVLALGQVANAVVMKRRRRSL